LDGWMVKGLKFKVVCLLDAKPTEHCHWTFSPFLLMPVPVMQVRIVRMLMGQRFMNMEVRMPLAFPYGFIPMRMGMVPVSMLMIMDVFHCNMRVQVAMNKQIGNDHGKRQKRN
ncbi:MAG TPA: hypothetical protein DCL77_12080, partial [Prolixibacteraceae bacterium]|nr:hypothetical protein [Prolixibacteraceae bacterium]